MRKILLLLLLFVSGYVAAQSNYIPYQSRNRWIAGKFDSTLHIPKGTTPGLYTGGYNSSGALFYKTSDSTVYVYTGTQWISVNGTGGGGSADSTLFANFINNQDTTDQDADFRISGKGYIGGKKLAYGNIINDNFSGTGFSSAYSTSVSNMWTDFSADYLQDSVITAAEGARTNYIQFNKWTARNNWSMTIKYVPVNTGSTHYGLGLGLKSQNSFYSSELFMHYVTANVFGDFGRQHLYLNNETWPYTQTTTGSNRITVTAGDTLRATLSYKDGVLTSSFQNLTTSERADTSYVYGTSVAGTKQAPNAGKFTLFFFGGKHKIFEWKISSDEKTGSVLFKGNSITYGYTATNHDSTFADLTMGGNRELYEKSGGPGDRSSEGVQTIWETRQLRPKYMVLALGNNDAQNGVTGSTYSANIRQIIDSAQSVGTTVILLSNFPLSTANTTTYNDTLKAIAGRYDLKYVNVFDSLKGGGTSYDAAYTTDGVHPNTAGHILIARILSREAPELLGTGSLYINTPSVAASVTHPLVWDQTTGEIQRTTVSAFSSPYPISFAKNSTRDSSILTLSNGTRYAVLDSLGGGSSSPYPASFSKNAGRDSIILTLSDGTRFAAKDSTGGASGLTVGTTTVSSSNSRGILYDSSGILKNRGDVAVFTTGEVGIGYTAAQGYKLSVNGSILSTYVTTTGTGTFISGLFTSGGFSTAHANSENADLYVRGGNTASTTTQSEISIGGASTTGNRASFRGSANYTMLANNSYGGVIFGKELQTEASSGTHPLYAKVAIRQDSVVNGTASTTHATSLYIQGPPTTNGSFGTSTSMWVESGDVLLSSGILTATNGLKTGDPGSGVGTWKLGTAVTTSGLVLNTTTYVEISIGGTVYRLAVVDPPQP